MTFFKNVVLTKVFHERVISLSNLPTHHDGFIMIPCMSHMVEQEI